MSISTKNVEFQVGDRVIHWVHGLGEVTRVDEKVLSGQTRLYYEVQMNSLTLFIPVDEKIGNCLRRPTTESEFKKLFRILASPGKPLPPDRYERQTYLMDKLNDGTLKSVCVVVRDLTQHKKVEKMNESDNSILNRARNSLLNEWSGVFSIPVQQAEIELQGMLGR